MFSPAVTRLFWKDTRALAGLWTAVLAGIVLVQMLAVLIHPRQGSEVGVFVGFAGPLTLCFAIAAAGILFAGETEEATDDWLRVLPIRRSALLSGKLLTAAAGVAALVAVAAVTGALCGWTFNHLRHRVLPGDASLQIVAAAGWCGLLGLAGLVAGTLCSLLQQRVITVFVSAILLLILLVTLIDLVADGIGRGTAPATGNALQLGSVAAALALLAVLDVWLGLKWADQRITWKRRERLEETATRGRVAAFWRNRVQAAASQGSPARRLYGVLVWRELRSVAGFLVLWLPLGVVLVDVVMRLWNIPWNILYFVLTPLASGLMTALPDQSRQTQLFLAERGVSPAAGWLTRQGVWLTLAILLTCGWAWWDQAAAPSRPPQPYVARSQPTSLVEMLGAVRRPSLDSVQPSAAAAASDRLRSVGFAASLLCSLFALGQFCGFLFRRPIMAAGIAFGMSLVLFAWHAFVLAIDVPFALSTWPLILLWLAATWLLMERWLSGDDSWAWWKRRAAWFVAPWLLAFCTTAYARRTQIPEVTLSAPLQRSLQDAEHRQRNYSPELTAAWARLVASLDNNRDLLVHSNSDAAVAPDDARLADLARELQSYAAEVRRRPRGVSLEPRAAWKAPQRQPAIAAAALKSGALLRVEGQPEEELQVYLDGLCILRSLPSHDPTDVGQKVTYREQLFAAVAGWANHPDRTAEQLRAALDSRSFQLETRYDLFVDAVGLMHAYVDQLRQWRARSGPAFEGHWSEAYERSPFLLDLLQVWHALTGEQRRLDRLTKALWKHTASSVSGPTGEASQLSPAAAVGPDDLNRWLASTPDWVVPPHLSPREWFQRMQELHDWNRRELMAERAATLIFALQVYRLEHGAFPDYVSQLRGTVLERVPVNPATGGEFEFEPHGLPAPLLGAKPPALIPAQQPLLWSRLPGAALAFRPGRPGEPPAAVEAGAYMEANRLNESSLSSLYWRAEPLHEHAIAFRTLGADGPEWLSSTSPDEE